MSVISCHGLYRGHASNHCVCCVLLWNEWEKLQGHIDFLSSCNMFLRDHQVFPYQQHFCDTKKQLLNYICNGHFLCTIHSSILSLAATKCCVNWTVTCTFNLSVICRHHCLFSALNNHFLHNTLCAVDWPGWATNTGLNLAAMLQNGDCTILQYYAN